MWQDGGQFFWSSNCNYPANDISSQTLNSITDCGNACNANSQCNHFIYHLGLKACNLKSISTAASAVGDDARQCGYIKNRFWLDNGDYVSIANCDYPGNDIVTKKFNSLADCANACVADSQCTHFGYGFAAYGGDCMFKKPTSSNPTMNTDNIRTCGYVK